MRISILDIKDPSLGFLAMERVDSLRRGLMRSFCPGLKHLDLGELRHWPCGPLNGFPDQDVIQAFEDGLEGFLDFPVFEGSVTAGLI